MVRFISVYFIFLVVTANWFISQYLFLIFHCWCPKKGYDFCIFTLYPEVLPNSFITLSTFLVESIRFTMFTIISYENNDSFTFSFSIWMPFIAFSCLIAVARTSNTMLNSSGESVHLCLVSDFSGKAFSLCPLSMMLSVGFSYMAFITLRYSSLYSRFAECVCVCFAECFFFYHKWMLYLIKYFFCIY